MANIDKQTLINFFNQHSAQPLELSDENIPSAVLIPIIEHRTELTVLFTQRSENLLHHPGQISFPGGAFESDDRDLIHTALRETEEEVGLLQSQINVIGELDSHRTQTGFIIKPIVGLIKPPLELTINHHEVSDTFEIPLDYLLWLENYRQEDYTRDGKQRYYYVIEFEDKRIWGATAGILFALARLFNF